MRARMQYALGLIDEGLAIYRGHFLSFLLIAAIWCVPVAVLGGLLVIGASWLGGAAEVLAVVGGGLALLPVTAYLLVGLARTADGLIAGRPVGVREALALHPLRALSMGGAMVVYGLLMQSASAIVLLICLCPLWMFGGAVLALMGSAAGFGAEPGSQIYTMAIGLLSVLIFLVGGYVSLLLTVGVGSLSMVYALHAWSIRGVRFGAALQLSLELLAYRFRTNLLVWLVGAMLTSAALLIVSSVTGLAALLPAQWLLGEGSPIAQAIGTSGALAGLVVVAPPVSIWMALLYRRNYTAREGVDLEERVRAWAERRQGR